MDTMKLPHTIDSKGVAHELGRTCLGHRRKDQRHRGSAAAAKPEHHGCPRGCRGRASSACLSERRCRAARRTRALRHFSFRRSAASRARGNTRADCGARAAATPARITQYASLTPCSTAGRSIGIMPPPGWTGRLAERCGAAFPRARRLPVRAPRMLSCERRYEVA